MVAARSNPKPDAGNLLPMNDRTISVRSVAGADKRIGVVQGRHGVFLYPTQDFVGQLLAAYGEWAEPEAVVLMQLLRPGDIAIDIGANIGTLAVPMARAVGPTGRIFAFEPQPLMFRLLNANAALNGLSQMRLHHMALGAADGHLPLPEFDYASPGNYSAFSYAKTPVQSGASHDSVPIRKLDDVLDSIDRCRLLKIDVEGMEPAVLDGAAALIERYKPILYLEANLREPFEAVLERLNRFGYRAYWHAVPGFNADNFAGNTENYTGVAGDVNLLCVPADGEIRLAGLHPATRFDEIDRYFPGLLGNRG